MIAPIVATDGLLMLQLPPLSELVNSVVLPTHTFGIPPIADGSGFTVSLKLAMQPRAVVYFMVAIPAETPDTSPDEGSTVATEGAVLLHEPPGVASFNVVVLPAHIAPVPVIGESGLTVKVVVAKQPAGVT